jgi:hypothetical protein
MVSLVSDDIYYAKDFNFLLQDTQGDASVNSELCVADVIPVYIIIYTSGSHLGTAATVWRVLVYKNKVTSTCVQHAEYH